MSNPGNAAWLIDTMQEWAPLHWAEEWDNVGLLLGDTSQDVKKVLVALDATDAVVREALHESYDFIICHHPLIYDPLKKITSETVQGRKLLTLLRAGIGLYCAHTNLDKAPGGVNDCLFAKLNFCEDIAPLVDGDSDIPGLGLVTDLPAPMPLSDFVLHVKNSLSLADIRYSGNPEAIVRRVGLCAGDASNPRYWQAALEKDCDAFITGDIRYHGAQDAREAGMALVDISHYAGEAFVIEAIVRRLREAAKAAGREIIIEATKTDGQIFYHS